MVNHLLQLRPYRNRCALSDSKLLTRPMSPALAPWPGTMGTMLLSDPCDTHGDQIRPKLRAEILEVALLSVMDRWKCCWQHGASAASGIGLLGVRRLKHC